MLCSPAGPTDIAPGFIALLIFGVWRSILTETQATNRNSSVSRTLKLAIVVVCFSLCGAGTFIVSTPYDKQSQQKTNVMPIKNPQSIKRNWIQT
jgi:hypothetical protein